jgi:hypothetical protein
MIISLINDKIKDNKLRQLLGGFHKKCHINLII